MKDGESKCFGVRVGLAVRVLVESKGITRRGWGGRDKNALREEARDEDSGDGAAAHNIDDFGRKLGVPHGEGLPLSSNGLSIRMARGGFTEAQVGTSQ